MSPIPTSPLSAHVHPKMLSSLNSDMYFRDEATFEEPSTSRTTLGGVSYAWTGVSGLIAAPCMVFAPHTRGLAQRDGDFIEELKIYTIMLTGYYPQIDPTWRVTLQSMNFALDILEVQSDSQQSLTQVICRSLKPSAVPGV